MTDPPEETPPASVSPPARRGALDPILSNRDGLFSALEEDTPARAPVPGKPWAHRRGEPRLFVLCWAIYLLAASGATIMRLPQMGYTEPRFVQFSARLLVLLIAIGLVLLWPMVRLSQAAPRRPVTATAVDIAALFLPLAAVLWPVTWLGRWPTPVTLALAGMLLSWGVLLGAIVALGVRRAPSAARTGWALLAVGIVVAGPALAAVLQATLIAPGVLLYASPLTAVFALTTEPSGRTAIMHPGEWWAGAAPLIPAVILWAVAGVSGRGGSPRRG